jgi:hypothetical protein
MHDGSKDSKNSAKSGDQVSRPLRYTRDQLLSQGDIDRAGAPLPEPRLDINIAISMIVNEISKIYPEGLQNMSEFGRNLSSGFNNLNRYGVIVPSGFLIGLQILDRISQTDNTELKNQYSPYGLCIAAMMLGTKFAEDHNFGNESWGRATGITREGINQIEVDMLKTLDFQPFNRELTEQKMASYRDELSKLESPPGTPGRPF